MNQPRVFHLLAAGASLVLFAAAPACHVKTGLPIGPQSVGTSNFSEVASASEPGGIDDPIDVCHQELGRDAGGKARSAHVLGDTRIKGCMIQGDKVDMYLIQVPEEVEAATYRIVVINHAAYMRTTLYTSDGEKLDSEWMDHGEAYRKNIQLEGGQTYRIVITNEHGSKTIHYSIEAKHNASIAEN